MKTDKVKLVEFKGALEEIEMLRKDKKTIYKIHTNTSFSDMGIGGYTTYGGKSGNKDILDIFIRDDLSSYNGLRQTSHELKHAFQFYDGDIIYAVDGTTGRVYLNNSRPLEEQAYGRSQAYGGQKMNPYDPYIMSLPENRVSKEQMQQNYPNYVFIFRKKK